MGAKEMDAKEKFDACMKLVDHAREEHQQRSQVEFRLTLAYWALLVAVIAFIHTEKPSFVTGGLVLETLAGSGLVFLILWTADMWRRSEFDVDVRNRYLKLASEILKDPDRPVDETLPERLKWWQFLGFLRATPSWFRIVATAALCYALYWVGTSTTVAVQNEVLFFDEICTRLSTLRGICSQL